MDRWKSRGGKSQRRERQKQEDQSARKGTVETSRITVVFPMSCGSERSKSRFPKAPGAEPSGLIRDENFHAGGAKHILKSKC